MWAVVSRVQVTTALSFRKGIAFGRETWKQVKNRACP